jgi:hypothetical protein
MSAPKAPFEIGYFEESHSSFAVKRVGNKKLKNFKHKWVKRNSLLFVYFSFLFLFFFSYLFSKNKIKQLDRIKKLNSVTGKKKIINLNKNL